MINIGQLHGVGLGPGATDLMSVRADRLIRGAKHVAFFRKMGRKGHAWTIASPILSSDVNEIALEYPVTTEIKFTDPRYNEVLSEFYENCCNRLKEYLGNGEDVVVLCEGDPFFYGSFMHLHSRLANFARIQVVPATTGMSGAWTATGQPITWGDDVLTVLMGTMPKEELVYQMNKTDALVIMKIGKNYQKVKAALKEANLFNRAWSVHHATMENQKVLKLSDYLSEEMPYFGIILVHGTGRRP
jgi:precorrin-2/cobalt-factor-2 C20-methyltransferase